MRRLLVVFAAILFGACPAAADGRSRETLAVVFEVELGEGGEIRTLKVDHVTDEKARKRRVKVPQAYLEAARDALQARYRGKPAARFFTYTLFDPGRPNDAGLGGGAAPPPDPGRTLELRPGQTALVRLRPDGRFGPVERAEAAEAPASQMEDVVVRGMASGEIGRSKQGTLPASPLKHLPSTPAIAGDSVRLTLKRAPGGGTVLVVENGYGELLYYRAWMRTGERGSATSVCEVAPKTPTYEHWPHPIEQLHLTGFGLRPPRSRDERECR
ncbi:MAG TPA: hypothetical protein VEA60_01460 [Allosphingosinicella sp.]|nr:hypothetical protein [Allosphingosinicella sp.]